MEMPGHGCDNPDHAGLRRMYTRNPDYEKDDTSWMGQDVEVVYLMQRRLIEENKDLWQYVWRKNTLPFVHTFAVTAAALLVLLFAWFLTHTPGR